MRANKAINFSFSCVFQRLSFVFRHREARELPDGNRQISQSFLKRMLVLACQDSCRCEYRDLFSGRDRLG